MSPESSLIMAAKLNLEFSGKMKQVSSVQNGDIQSVIAYKSNRNTVTVLKNTIKQVVLSTEDTVTDFSVGLSTADQTWTVFSITETGYLYKTTEQRLQQQLKSSVRSPNQAIFSDLLGAGDKEDDVECQMTTTPVIIFDKTDALYHFQNQPVSISVTGKLIAVTMIQSQDMIKTEIFRDTDLQQGKGSTCLRTLNLKNNNFEEKLIRKISTKFIVSESSQWLEKVSSDCVCVSDHLYQQMFGQEVCLLKTPVLLIYPPGGGVYYQAVRTLCLLGNQNDDSFKVFCDTGSSVVNVIGIKPYKTDKDKVTCELEAKQPNGFTLNSALAVVSENGSVIVQSEKKDQSSGARFTKHLIPGPVMDVCGSRDTVYHTTGKWLYQTKVSYSVKDDQSTKGHPSFCKISSKCIRQVGLIGIVEDLQGGNSCTDSCCVVSLRGCDRMCQLIEIGVSDNHSKQSDTHLSNPGQRMKDLLLSMNSLDDSRQETEVTWQNQNYWLANINMAAMLIQSHLNQGRKNIDKDSGHQLIQCTWSARIPDSAEETVLYLDCSVTNKMERNLSHDWGAMVTAVSTASDEIVSKCMKFTSGVMSGSSVRISVPVKPEKILAGFTAQVFLILDVDMKLGHNKSGEVPTVKHSLVIPVTTMEVDVLFFLLPGNQSSVYKCLHGDGIRQWENVVESVAEYRPASALYNTLTVHSTSEVDCGQQMEGEGDIRVKVTAPGEQSGYSRVEKIPHRNQSVRKQSEVCVSITVCIKNNSSEIMKITEMYGQGADGVLKFVLSDSGLGDSLVVTSGQCSVVTMSGHQVHLGIQLSEKETNVIVIQCQVRSGLSSAAAVRRAVTTRLQSLLIDEIPSVFVEARDIYKKQKILQEAEKRLNLLQTLQLGTKQLPWLQILDCISDIYQKLKSVLA